MTEKQLLCCPLRAWVFPRPCDVNATRHALLHANRRPYYLRRSLLRRLHHVRLQQ